MRGRKRNLNMARDAQGVSREHERRQRLDYEARLARRALDLIGDGVGAAHAEDKLAGSSLGRLLLRGQADRRDPGGISQRHYNTGQRWSHIVYRHAALMGYRLQLRTPSFDMVGGGESCAAPPDDAQIAEVRNDFRLCYDAVMEVCRLHTLRAREATYGVCILNWPLSQLRRKDFGLIRLTLNAIGKALGKEERGR